MKSILKERNVALVEHYAQNKNMAQTGLFFNISRERVRQILNAAGVVEHAYPKRLRKTVHTPIDIKTTT